MEGLLDGSVIEVESPSIKRMLKIFEPIMFPTAMSFSFLRAAITLVTSSGRLVPKATIVSPISVSLIPAAFAINVALFTTS